MVDRTEVEGVERRSERVDPFDGEPVLAQRVVLSPERLTLRVIDSEPQAADAPERITRELLEPIERPLGELQHEPGSVGAQQPAGLVVGRRGTTQRESAVAAAGSARDFARLVQTHAHSVLGERQRARTTRHTTADDGDLGTTVEAGDAEAVVGLLQPERGRRHDRESSPSTSSPRDSSSAGRRAPARQLRRS